LTFELMLGRSHSVRENRRKQKIFRSHEKFHIQLLRTATKFFQNLREKGVRAHSWG